MKTKTASISEVTKAFINLRYFIGKSQLSTMGDFCRGEEREFFKQKAIELAKLVGEMPKPYETDGQGDKAVAYLHYFKNGSDWFITERDSSDEQHQAFGLACLGDDPELGYISILELLQCGAQIDLHWTPKTIADCRKELAEKWD